MARTRAFAAMKCLAAVAALTLAWSDSAHAKDAVESSTWRVALHAASAVWRSEVRRDAKAWIRRRVVQPVDLERYGLELDAGWHERPDHEPLVVLLLGYNSPPDRRQALLRPIRTAGFACGSFSYPNDHDLAESARSLSEELRDFRLRHGNRRFVLLTHSMGGLVARACVESSELDPGNVEHLIMIAPPSHGTQVAHLAKCADLWEHGLLRLRGGPVQRLRDSIVDGLAEAAYDLRPGSAFLTRLNAGPRNPNIRYTMLLGTGGKLTARELESARSLLRRTAGKVPGLRKATRKVDHWLEGMDELIQGKGDGVVAIERALLAGVDDVVILPFGHVSVAGDSKSASVVGVHREIVARLNQFPATMRNDP